MNDPLLEGEAYARTLDPETSHEAAEGTRGEVAARLERAVWEALLAQPQGLTSHELVDVTGIPYESVTPRIKPLRKLGLVLDSGTRRLSARPGSRRRSIVWAAALQQPIPQVLWPAPASPSTSQPQAP